MRAVILALLMVSVVSAQDINIGDFLAGNVLIPLLSDLSNGSINLIQNALNSLIGSLFGKRDLQAFLPQVQPIIQNLLATYVPQLQGIFQTLMSSLISNISSITGLLGPGRTLARVENTKAVASAKYDLQQVFQSLINDLTSSLQSLGLPTGQLQNLLGSLAGKRDIFSDLLSGLNQTISQIGSSVTILGNQLLEAVSPHIQNLQQELINHGLNAAQSLTQTLAGISSTLGK